VLVRLLKTLVIDWQRSRVLGQIRALRRGGVLRLKKAIYGLKQAPRAWWLKLHAFLQQLGFKANKSDVCLYVMHVTGGAVVLLLLYVDDIIVAASTAALVERYVALISKTFRVSSEGPLTSYLGFDIRVDLTKRRVYMCMKRYVEKVFKKFKLAVKQSVLTPLQEGIEAALPDAPLADDQFTNDFEYREKVGSILYYMLCMRPDISFSIGLLARYSTKVSRVAAAGVTHLLHFVYNTRGKELVLGGANAYIKAFCDADWAGDRDSRRSTSCHIVYLGSGPVEWASKLQRLQAQSTAEAEYLAMNAAVRTIVWLRWLLFQIGIPALITKYSSTVFTNNTAAEASTNNPAQSEKTKHIAIKYHLVRELVQAGVVATEHVDTLVNPADVGTKVLGRRKFEPIADLALGRAELVRPTKRKRTETSDEFV